MPFLLHPNCILKEGLIRANIDEATQQRRSLATNVEHFKSFCGRHPQHLARAFGDFQIAAMMSEEEAATRESFDGFLLATGNDFLKCCDSNNVRFARFPECNKNKLTMLTWQFVDCLELLKEWKITCPTVWPIRLGATADGTHSRTNEPRDPDVRCNPTNFHSSTTSPE